MIVQAPRGTPPNPGNSSDADGAAALPDYVFRATHAAACPAYPLIVRQAAVRALGQFRDPRAESLLRLVAHAPSTGDDVQDALLRLTANRSLTMIVPENVVSDEVTSSAADAVSALKESLPAEVSP